MCEFGQALEIFVSEFEHDVEGEGFILNCDETDLFWKKRPKRTFIVQEDKTVPGHVLRKNMLTLLLCDNASGDCKGKSLLVYHLKTSKVFIRNNV